MKSIYSIFALLLFSFPLASQVDSCALKFKTINSNYESGQFDQTIKILNSILKSCSLEKAEKIQVYELLILSYLKIDNLEEADNSAKKLLRFNPTYRPDKIKDDPKLIAEFARFKPKPVFAIGISGGLNQNKTNVTKTRSILYNDDKSNLGSYEDGNGFQFNLFAERQIIKNLWILSGFGFRTANYAHILDSIVGGSVTYKEKLSYFDVPLQLKYYCLSQAKFSPFITLGTKFSFLNSALATSTLKSQKDLVDRLPMRTTSFVNYSAGIGVCYNYKTFRFLLMAEYNNSSQFLNKTGTLYNDPINTFKYYYIDDDFSMNHISISVGIIYNFIYKNKKS